MAITSNVAATILILSFVAPAMAQSAFPNFDYQKECEEFGQPHPPTRQAGDITMLLINNCLDEETSSRKSAEYKWELASENVRAEAMAHVHDIMRYSSSGPFYGYLNGSLSAFSELEANKEALKRLHEKRPGVHY
jgi:hypothetical protein